MSPRTVQTFVVASPGVVWLVVSFWVSAIIVGSLAILIVYSSDYQFEEGRVTHKGLMLPSRWPGRGDTCASSYRVSQPRDWEFAFLINAACEAAEARERAGAPHKYPDMRKGSQLIRRDPVP